MAWWTQPNNSNVSPAEAFEAVAAGLPFDFQVSDFTQPVSTPAPTTTTTPPPNDDLKR